MRKKILALLIVITVIGTFIPIYIFAAPDDNITMEAEVGFDGHFKLTRWIPVSVYIENRGEDIKGDIEIVANQDSSTAMLFTAPAVIPKDSKKRIDLYVRMNTLQKRMDIDLTSQGKVLKTIEMDGLIPMSTANFMLGVLTDDQSGLNYWWEKQTGDRLFTNYEPIALKADDIPSRREVMDNFSMLIIDDFDTSQLSKVQKTSISDWINRGGILLVGTGSNGIKTLKGFSDDILQVEGGNIYTEVKPKILEDLAETEILTEVPIELMELNFDGSWKVVAEKDSNPYVLMKKQGQGYIFISSFDLGKQPITGWTGSKALWEGIFEKHIEHEAFMMLKDPQYGEEVLWEQRNYGIYEALANISEMDPPSAERLIGILFIYLAIVGPVNYFILKKLDRRELAWFTIPVFVILFSLGIYRLGSMAKGSEVVANVISTVELSEDNPSKKVNTYTGVFIPKRGDYDFSIEGDRLLVPTIDRDYYDHRPDSGGIKNVTAQIVQGANPSAKVFDINMWTMETFSTETYLDDLGSIDGDLVYRDGKIVGSIENNTSSPLEDVVVMTNIGYYKVGNLAGGAKKDIEFGVIEFSNVDPYPDSIKYRIMDDLYPGTDEGVHFTRRRLIQELVPIPSRSVNASGEKEKGDINLEAIVFGFNDQKLGDDIYVNGKSPKKSYYTNLVMDKMDIRTNEDGRVVIFPGMVTAKIDAEKSEHLDRHEAMGDMYEIYLYGPKKVAFYFEMGDFNNIDDIESLNIYLKTGEGKWHGGVPVVISIYDSQMEDFVDTGEGLKIDRDKGTIDMDPSLIERYTDDSGRLYIKVGLEEDVDRDIAIFTPTIGIEGRKR